MGRVIMCIGQYAAVPYRIEREGICLYSIEELCYFIYDNLIFLDQEFINPAMVEWIEKECALNALAEKLYRSLKSKASQMELITIILRETFYCTEKELSDMQLKYAGQADLNPWEKRKSRIDYLYHKGRYLQALQEYEILREELSRNDPVLSGKLSHNIGVIYTELYMFEPAAVNFSRAFEENGDPESYLMYLASKRILLRDKEYLEFLSGEQWQGSYQASLELEKRVEELERNWQVNDMKKKLDELQAHRNNSDAGRYCRKAERMCSEWKEQYRADIQGF